MIKRLFVGLAKGTVVGALLGGLFQVVLGWAPVAGLFGFLLAIGAVATTGLVAGKAPWRQDTWIEGALKAVGGIIVGALLYWLLSKFAAFAVPRAVPPLGPGVAWTVQPLLILPALCALYGMLIELDNSDDQQKRPKPGARTAPRVSVPKANEIEDAVLLDE